MRQHHFVSLFLSITMLTACVNVASYHTRDGALHDLGKIIVVHNVGDDLHLEQEISDILQQRGFEAVAVEGTNIPTDAHTLVYYVPYWVETDHEHTLHIHFHDVRTQQLLAAATASRSLFQSTNPRDIIKQTLDTLFSRDN